MYENELYLLIDQIVTMITLTIWVILGLYWYFKTYALLHQQQEYLEFTYNMKPYNVDYQKALLDYKFKIKELKRRK